MKKIFTTLAFICVIIFSTTALASWNQAYTEENGNEWHIEKETVAVDKNSGGALELHANFLRVFSEKGLQQIKENYSKNNDTFPANARYEMSCIHFKEEGGSKYFSVTESFFLDADSKTIEEGAYFDKPIEWKVCDSGSIVDELFKAAKKYV